MTAKQVKFWQFKVLTFDCYGTLIDWERGLTAAADEAKIKYSTAGEFLNLFSSKEARNEAANPTMLYPQILAKSIGEVAEELGRLDSLPAQMTEEEKTQFGASIGNWQPFADTTEALRYLQDNYKLVILSNVDRESFARTEASIGVKFDMIVTAQDVGSYKPDVANFHYVLKAIKDKWGYEQKDVLHVFQSLFHDAVPANKIGLNTVHIQRVRLDPNYNPVPNPMPHLDWNFPTLEAFAASHRYESKYRMF